MLFHTAPSVSCSRIIASWTFILSRGKAWPTTRYTPVLSDPSGRMRRQWERGVRRARGNSAGWPLAALARAAPRQARHGRRRRAPSRPPAGQDLLAVPRPAVCRPGCPAAAQFDQAASHQQSRPAMLLLAGPPIAPTARLHLPVRSRWQLRRQGRRFWLCRAARLCLIPARAAATAQNQEVPARPPSIARTFMVWAMRNAWSSSLVSYTSPGSASKPSGGTIAVVWLEVSPALIRPPYHFPYI